MWDDRISISEVTDATSGLCGVEGVKGVGTTCDEWVEDGV